MPAVLRALVALGFFLIGVTHLRGYLASARRPGTAGCRAARVDRLAQAFMNIEMAATMWPLRVPDRWGVQATVLAIVTGWFAVRALTSRPVLFHHALSAAAMTGMLTFPLMTHTPAAGPAAGAAMPHMPMPDTAHSGSGTHLGVLIGYCLLASAAWWMVVAYRSGRRIPAGPAADALAHAAMAIGMAAMLVPLG